MKNILVAVAILLSLNVHAQITTTPGTRPATQTEVNAGTSHTVFVAPDTLAAALIGVSGPTNGVSSSVVSNIVSLNNAASATVVAAGNTNRWAATNGTEAMKWTNSANVYHGAFSGIMDSNINAQQHLITNVSTVRVGTGGTGDTVITGGGIVSTVGISTFGALLASSYNFNNNNDGSLNDVDGVGMSFVEPINPDFYFGTSQSPVVDGTIHALNVYAGTFYGDGSHLTGIAGGGSATNAIANNSGSGTNTTLYGQTDFIGTDGDSNAWMIASGGGSVILSNGVTAATLIVPPSGPVTATGGFDIGTNTGSVIINGNVTVSNSIVVVASYIPTNSTPSHIIYIGETDITTNGTVIYTGIDRILVGMYNYGVQHIHNTGGSVNAITPAAAWHINGTWFVTNGGSSIVSVYVGPRDSSGNLETNAICYAQY
jgi:hypothetical protein